MEIGNLADYGYYFTPGGREAIVNLIRDFKRAYGADWIKHFKAENPELSIIVDLVANHTAHDAFLKLKEYIAGQIEDSGLSDFSQTFANSLAMRVVNDNEQNITETHALLLKEIDRKRF